MELGPGPRAATLGLLVSAFAFHAAARPVEAQPGRLVDLGGAGGVSRVGQSESMWCWAASTEMILASFQRQLPQCEIVTERVRGRKNCCDEAAAAKERELVAGDRDCLRTGWPRLAENDLAFASTKCRCLLAVLAGDEWRERFDRAARGSDETDEVGMSVEEADRLSVLLEGRSFADLGAIDGTEECLSSLAGHGVAPADRVAAWAGNRALRRQLRDAESCHLSWEELRAELDSGSPVAFAWRYERGGGHIMVATGYFSVPVEGDEARWVVVHDPWPPGSGQDGEGGDQLLMPYEYFRDGVDGRHWRDYFAIRRAESADE